MVFAAYTFSSDIFWSLFFLGFEFGFTCSVCSIISLLTPMRSEVDHTMMPLFLSRKANSSACSSALVSVLRQTTLSGTLRSNATFLKSSSALMTFLNYVVASALMGHDDCWYCSDSSPRKCTFLCPGVKPYLIFLASFWLPKTNTTPMVAGILRQRYHQCRAASKVFSNPLPMMAL
jgi:hypothetical protein